jgi:hypothetical protein
MDRTERGDPMTGPPLDARRERARAGTQRIARRAREAFRAHGQRGVMIVHLQDRPPFVPRLEYHVMETDDGTENARVMRELLETYDPERQAVLYNLDARRGRASAEIVDIEMQH